MDNLSADLASLTIDRSPKQASRPWRLLWLLPLLAVMMLARWAYPRVHAQLFRSEVALTTITTFSPTRAATTVTATGYVVAERRALIGSDTPARIAALHVHEGSEVTQGDALVELDAVDRRSRVRSAEARVAASAAHVTSALAQLHELRIQLDRQRGLLVAGAATRSSVEDLAARFDTATSVSENARADRRTALAELNSARDALAQAILYAPFAGTVLDRPLDVGSTVDLGHALLELADLRSLVVEIDVPESRLSLVHEGDPCEISLDAFASKHFFGRVQALGKRVQRAKATRTIKVAFRDATEGVLPDMSARVNVLSSLPGKPEPERTIVPRSAIATRDGKPHVFVLQGDVVRAEPVTLGRPSSGGYELESGPVPGTRVVNNPSAELASGQRIRERLAP